MMIDVDYMSRLHNNLVRQHMILANALLVADRNARPCAYKEHTWEYVLSKGKYSIKPSTKFPMDVHNYFTNGEPASNRAKVAVVTPTYRSTSPVLVMHYNHGTRKKGK